ncbi:MAG: DUF5050 domain-containing protein [Candidatus Riflebacteria bacterium]|nr:DUF5050 domain-containing protein [Candidatus Riflebacteria bacterium]
MKRKMLIALILVQVLVCFAAQAADLPGGRILYIDSPSAESNYLATINPDGSGKIRLTPAFNNIMFPRYNETSGWIGFTNKTSDMTSEIYLLNKSGDRLRRVLTGAAFEDFSPDGKFFLYTTCNGKAELFVYSLERKQANKISQDLKVTAASWSNNGEWIAVSALTDDGSSDLYIISTLAQGIKRITATEKINESFPVFSKDGKFLVYFTDRHGDNELEYLAVDQSEVQRPIVRGIYPSLSPDNSWVAFQNGNTIGLCTIEGLEQRTLIAGRTPSWIK